VKIALRAPTFFTTRLDRVVHASVPLDCPVKPGNDGNHEAIDYCTA
jgi:hypothetical protein